MLHSVKQIGEEREKLAKMRKSDNFSAEKFLEFAEKNKEKYNITIVGDEYKVSTWYVDDLIRDFKQMNEQDENFLTFSEFKISQLKVKLNSLNEGMMMDTLKGVFSRIVTFFSDSEKLNKQIDQASSKAGDSDDKATPSSIKAGSTIFVRLINPKTNAKIIMSFTCLVIMPDGSGLYQITGSDSATFLKTMNVKDSAQLTTMGVLAIVDSTGFIKDKPISMRLYKNIDINGKVIVTENVVDSVLAAEDVAKETITAPKPATATPASNSAAI